MSVRKYLPSTQFVTIVGALALSTGLVYAAEWVHAPQSTAQLTPTSNVPSQANWQQTLDEIQANAGVSLPDAPDQGTVDHLVAGVQSNNLTDSVARSLLIRLTDAKAQGLGDDIPTQDQLIAQAAATLKDTSATVYTKASINAVDQNNDTLRSYGNKVMTLFASHTKAKVQAVLLAAGQAVDYNDGKYLSGLPVIQADYAALAADLDAVPVPLTIAPLHLQLVNDLSQMSSAVGNIRSMTTDPLRGITGLQNFEAAGDEAARVLTTIANSLSKSGILFTKDEPGASWSAFVSGT